MSEAGRFIAYELHDRVDIPLTTAPIGRDWMDGSPQRFAYRCLPLAIANQAGWLLHCPATFTATWNGGPYQNGININFETPGQQPTVSPWAFSVDSFTVSAQAQARDERITSHFGVGTLTFSVPFLFRTPPGVNLWVKGPTNWIKDGIQALEGVVETDWMPSTFTMNWKFTRPNWPVRFEKGEPFCMLVPIPRGLSESLEPIRRSIKTEPALEKEYRDWLAARDAFLKALIRHEPEAVQRGWQRDYVHGVTPSGTRAEDHQTRLSLKEFTRDEPGAQSPSPLGGEGEAGNPPLYWRNHEMTERAATDHPVNELIAKRWSPYAFADRAVPKAELLSLLEAARWAPSSYNEQPWSYIVATREEPEEFGRVLSCLVEGNQVWAKAAPVLALGCTSLKFKLDGRPNAAAMHDLGLSSGNLVLEATARGLCVHQMIGILPDKAIQLYQIPDGVQPLTGIAIGYPGDPAALPEAIRSRDAARRPRKALSAFVFGGKWGTPAPLVS